MHDEHLFYIQIRTMEQTQQFLNFLQSCITPVALVSGIGLLLLTLTNRLGRTIDCSRNLVVELDNKAIKKRNQKEIGDKNTLDPFLSHYQNRDF